MACFAQDMEMRIRLVETAKKYLGTPYVYGAQSPKAFDCSGFVSYVYREVLGIELERSSRGMFATGTTISAKDAKPGDVFIYDTVGGRPSHVAMFIGEGKIIHAISEGPKTGVVISAVDDKYFGPRQIGSRLYLAIGKNGAQVAAATPAQPPVTPPAAQPTPATASTAQPTAAPLAAVTPAVPPVPTPAVPTPAVPPVPTPAITATQPALAAPVQPAATPSKQAEEPVVVDIGFVIPKEKITFTDKIPAQVGTSISFTARNETGADGTFIVIFYKTEKNFSASKELRQERIQLKKGGTFEIPAYRFVEPGIYKLIVKQGGIQLVERIFTVQEK